MQPIASLIPSKLGLMSTGLKSLSTHSVMFLGLNVSMLSTNSTETFPYLDPLLMTVMLVLDTIAFSESFCTFPLHLSNS